MATICFTTIPCEPYIDCKVQGKPSLCNICSCAKGIVYARFEDFRISLYVYMSVVKVLVCQELWVNVPVTTFFFSYGGLCRFQLIKIKILKFTDTDIHPFKSPTQRKHLTLVPQFPSSLGSHICLGSQKIANKRLRLLIVLRQNIS